MDPNVAGKRLLIKQINKLPLHADLYFCCRVWWGQGDSIDGWGALWNWKVGASYSSLCWAWLSLCILQDFLTEEGRGFQGWRVPSFS